MNDSQIILPDGRVLAYLEIGEPSWPCLFFFHGAPLSRLHLAYLADGFVAEKIRVIAPERPGYGRSSPQPGRTLAGWSSDVRALADALGADRFLVSGHSSGGPYAVSCAALLSERVAGGIVLAGVTDMGWGGAWEGYSAMESALMRIAGEQEVVAWCVERFGADGARFHDVSDFEFGAPDHALFADRRAGPAIGKAVAEAFRQGIVGYAHDVFVQSRPWTFDRAADRGASGSPARRRRHGRSAGAQPPYLRPDPHGDVHHRARSRAHDARARAARACGEARAVDRPHMIARADDRASFTIRRATPKRICWTEPPEWLERRRTHDER